VGDRVPQREHGQLLGERGGRVAVGGCRRHLSVPRIGTERGRAGRLNGSSTVRIPSSYVASAPSASTSAPSDTTRRNGPRSISSCWYMRSSDDGPSSGSRVPDSTSSR